MQDAGSRSARTITANCDKSTTTSENTTPKATVHYTTSPPNYHINQPKFLKKSERLIDLYCIKMCSTFSWDAECHHVSTGPKCTVKVKLHQAVRHLLAMWKVGQTLFEFGAYKHMSWFGLFQYMRFIMYTRCCNESHQNEGGIQCMQGRR